MPVYLVETYLVGKNRAKKYTALMRRIHRSLRKHSDEIPELVSYKTSTAGMKGSKSRFVEVSEFTDLVGERKFIGRFAETKWLGTLGRVFHQIVRKPTSAIWGEFLKGAWFVR